MEQTFDRKHAKAILKPCLRADDDFKTDEPTDDPASKDYEPIERCKKFKIDKRGVWPLDETDVTDKEMFEFGQWRPVQVFMDEPGAPDVADTPMLPFPFTARDLAAFMVYGVGALVAGHYGDWADGPDPDRLNDIPQHENFARLAVKSAFEARREAERIVKAYPLELDAEAVRASKAWSVATTEANMREGVSDSIPCTDESRLRRARAVASTAALDSAMKDANDAAQTESETWLKAMVRQLLQRPATPAPVLDAVELARDAIEKRREKKPTIESVAMDYMREVYKAGQFQSAANFHKHLIKTAGVNHSPFQLGTGEHARKLFCPAASSFFEAGTLGKIWAKIRAA